MNHYVFHPGRSAVISQSLVSSSRPYPKVISKSGMRPDIVIHSQSTKQMIMIKLTVPYESRIEAAQIYKTEKYADLASSFK